MSDLTDAQEKAYVGEIKAILDEYKGDLLTATPPVDATARIAQLTTAEDLTEKAEAAQVKTEAANDAAIKLANENRKKAYDLAQASVSLMEGSLTKSHPAVEKARSIRGEMVNLAARGPRPTAPAKPPTP